MKPENSNTTGSPHTSISAEMLEAVRQAILANEVMLDYRGLAARLGVSERTLRGMVGARIIRPAIRRGNVVRFHWPSVVDQLIRGDKKGL